MIDMNWLHYVAECVTLFIIPMFAFVIRLNSTVDKLPILVEKLRAEMYKDYASKDDLRNFMVRYHVLEKQGGD
jgi:hypothetical protein